MDYTIIQYDSVPGLEKLVIEYLKKGWKCQGGVSVAVGPSSSTWWYYQAMIKEDEEMPFRYLG